MTREAKIGMLTGLGVIVLVGVLLSEYLGTGVDAGQRSAGLNNMGESYRKTTVAPSGLPLMNNGGTDAVAMQPVVTPGMAELPRAYAAERGSVDTRNMLGTPVEPKTTQPSDPSLAVGPTVSMPLVDAVQPGVTPVIEAVPSNGAIIDASKGVEPAVYVAIDASKLPVEKPVIEPVKLETKAAPKGVEHTIVAGDSLDKLAKKYFGAATKPNKDKIIAANRGILKDEKSVLVVGKKLIMPVEEKKETVSVVEVTKTGEHVVPVFEPAKKDAKVALDPAKKDVAKIETPKSEPKKDEAKKVEAKKEEPKKDGGVYIVKKGDTLAAIAKRVSAKDPNGALAKIMKLNGLKDANAIKEGQKLKLPAV